MDNKIELLSIEEQDIIGKAVYEMLKECPMIQNGIAVQYGSITNNSISVFAVSGAIVSKRYINGGFIGLFPFVIRYRSKPTNNEDRIQRENLMNQIANWLSGKETTYNNVKHEISEYPAMTEGREIKEIEQQQNAYIVSKADDGTVDFQVSMRLKYNKKGMY